MLVNAKSGVIATKILKIILAGQASNRQYTDIS